MKGQVLPPHIRQMVDRLNEEDLHALYSLVGERLRLFHRTKALFAMRDFQILDKVYFIRHGKRKEGTVTRLNQRTISVTLDDGTRWNVSPDFLKKVDDKDQPNEILLIGKNREKLVKSPHAHIYSHTV